MKRFITYVEFYDLLAAIESNPTARINAIFVNFVKLFNGTEDNVYWNQVVGHEQDSPIPKITKYIDDAADVLKGSLIKYETRYVRFPWTAGEPVRRCFIDSQGNISWNTQINTDIDAYNTILSNIEETVDRWVRQNKNSVIRTLSAFDLMYSPIENYNRVEDTTNDKNGTRSIERTYEENADPHSIEVNAPISAVTINSDNFNLTGVTPVAKQQVETVGNGATSSDNIYGGKHGTATAGNNGSSASGTIGDTVTTENQVTTFDSDTYHNNNKTIQEGSTNQNTVSSAYSKTDVIGNAIIRKEKVDPGYKDSETFEEYGDNIKGSIKGNIGVTTTQQMILQEYELRKKNLVDEYISSLFELILLQVG